MPPVVIEAVLLLVLHTPPVTVSVSEAVPPVHILDAPPIVPAVKNELIVIVLLVDNVPHAVVTVYIKSVDPVLNAVTTPEPVTVARLLLMLQLPPGVPVVSTYNVNVPAHMIPGPAIVPATGAALTVTVIVVLAVPQPVTTV